MGLSHERTMIGFEDAKRIVFEEASKKKLGTESVPLNMIEGRVCANEIKSPLDIQPFDNAAMDGYAVCLNDILKASPESPVTLPVAGVIAAGDPVPEYSLAQQSCIQIMTGAPVPSGAQAVVPIEHIKQSNAGISFFAPAPEGGNIRRAGEDFKKGAVLCPASTRFSARHILPLATLGVDKVEVFKKPRIVFISTGKELVDDLSKPLASGQIYNSNRPYARSFLESMGAQVIEMRTIFDDLESFERILEEIEDIRPDLVLSSGAVSAGTFDFVRQGLESNGAEILFHKIKVKPGKPNLFARLRNGALYFGMPGNPVATAVALRFLVEPALRALCGRSPEQPLRARLKHGLDKKPGLHLFLKGKSEIGQDGVLTVKILEGQESFMVNPFLCMNAWVSLPPEACDPIPGQTVQIFPVLPDSQ